MTRSMSVVMKKFLPVVVIAIALLIAGCAATATAPRTADGGKVRILVMADRGDPATMTEKQFEMRNQVGEWMERDLLNILRRTGYEAQLVRKAEEYTPASGNYLLKVSIVSYNPGSKAARMMVGYGAGATSLNTRYELIGSGAKPLLSDDLGVGSSRDWNYCARKINEQTVEAVSSRLRQI